MVHGIGVQRQRRRALASPCESPYLFACAAPFFVRALAGQVALLCALLQRGHTTLLLDADAVLLADPLPFLRQFLPEADLLITSDSVRLPPRDGGLDDPAIVRKAMVNIGVMFARPGAATALARSWLRHLEEAPTKAWDQEVLGSMLHYSAAKAAERGDFGAEPVSLEIGAARKRLTLVWGERVVAGVLPSSLFCSGFSTVAGYCAPQRRDSNASAHAQGLHNASSLPHVVLPQPGSFEYTTTLSGSTLPSPPQTPSLAGAGARPFPLGPYTFHAAWLFYDAYGKRSRMRALRI